MQNAKRNFALNTNASDFFLYHLLMLIILSMFFYMPINGFFPYQRQVGIALFWIYFFTAILCSRYIICVSLGTKLKITYGLIPFKKYDISKNEIQEITSHDESAKELLKLLSQEENDNRDNAWVILNINFLRHNGSVVIKTCDAGYVLSSNNPLFFASRIRVLVRQNVV